MKIGSGLAIREPGSVRFNENIDIERGDWFQIECRSGRATDRVAFNHTVGLHTVDHLNDFFYAHAARTSPKRPKEKGGTAQGLEVSLLL